MRTRSHLGLRFFVACSIAALFPLLIGAQQAYPPNGSAIPVVKLTGGGEYPPGVEPKAGPIDKPSAWNMELVGHNDLQGRSAYQPLIINQDGREIAYVGHHDEDLMMNPLSGKMEMNGTSIVDVTDPAHTKYLAHIATGTDRNEAGAQMVRVCSGNTLPHGVKGKWYLLRPLGNSAHEIYDVTDPSKPTKLVTVVSGLNGTHKSWWECDTGIAYLVANRRDEGWTGGNHLKIYDLSDPAKPVYIRDFGLLGSQPNAKAFIGVKKGIGIHGPISAGPAKNRVYIAYGTGNEGVIQIVDRQKLLTAFKNPLKPTDEEMLAPQVGVIPMSPDQGAHTTMPLFDVPIPGFQGHVALRKRDLLLVASESSRSNACGAAFPDENDRPAPHLAFLLDITNEATPWPLSTFRVQETQGDYCGRGGRFGVHSSAESFYAPYYGKLAVFAWFNAGVRVWDIRDPFAVHEVAYFIPPPNDNSMPQCTNANTKEGGERGKVTANSTCKKVAVTNNVEIDDRGLIYTADRPGGGLHIARLTGYAKQIVASPGSN